MLFIPSNDDQRLEICSSIHLDTATCDDDTLRRKIFPLLLEQGQAQDPGEESTAFLQIQSNLLLRPSQDRPGLVAYHLPYPQYDTMTPNRRATCFAMTCGLFQCRFYGHVLIDFVKAPGSSFVMQRPELFQALFQLALAGAVKSPDYRQWKQKVSSRCIADAFSDPLEKSLCCWILQAAHENYHDKEAVQRWAEITSKPKSRESNSDDEDCTDDSDADVTNSDSENGEKEEDLIQKCKNEFVTNEPLCLHCRRPTRNLCEQCRAAYFCPPPRDCRQQGWSHDCLCSTWKCYVDRREKLSTFPFKDAWYKSLVSRSCQISNAPYEDDFLTRHLGVTTEEEDDSSWWATERFGWSGGSSASAQQVYPERRVSYQRGFAPLDSSQIPLEENLPFTRWEALHRENGASKNEAGLYRLLSWRDYYRLRQLPESSPAALLLTFPLTLYYGIVEYGVVPWTVARMLDRPLRIDIVGAEKELNFLDLFQEVVFLLSGQIEEGSLSSPLLEFVFVIRNDMLPASLVGQRSDGSYGLNIDLSPSLHLRVVEGTYGDSLNPDLDCGFRIGPPDMIMAFNAGLYAYDSWRSVLKYLKQHSSTVGVFTDYNEWSGLQCASLGGSIETLQMNPFRQPRAMPVYSMNLPQFSNGFMYAINPQELE